MFLLFVIVITILLINKCDQLPPRRTSQKMPSSARKRDEEQDDGNYEEILNCIEMEVIYKRNKNFKDECIKKNSNKEESKERGDSVQSKHSTSRSTFSCQRFVR